MIFKCHILHIILQDITILQVYTKDTWYRLNWTNGHKIQLSKNHTSHDINPIHDPKIWGTSDNDDSDCNEDDDEDDFDDDEDDEL